MHDPARRRHALDLIDSGLSDAQVASRMALPRTTVRDWRRAVDPPPRERCPRCWRPIRALGQDSADYAQLLGLYLGDGCISVVGRVHSLRISLDASYPAIVQDAHDLLVRCFPDNAVNRVRADRDATVILCVYSVHLPCLLPQHGPGKKHLRSMALEPWQWDHVVAAPWMFLRGCLWSDGCSFINRTGPYEYLSFDFYNYSGDILDLFMAACDLVGLHPRRYARRARLYRRDDVARLVENVGTKQRIEPLG